MHRQPLVALILATSWLAACGQPERGAGDATGTVPDATVTVTADETVTASAPVAGPSAADDPCGEDLARFGFIFVTAPRPGERVRNPFSVVGCANTFEANVEWRLVAGDGATLAKGFTTATCGTGCVGDYRFEVRFPPAPRRIASLEVFETSEADGSVRSLNAIPLVLEP